MDTPNVSPDKTHSTVKDAFDHLRLPKVAERREALKNANAVHTEQISALNRLAMAITSKVGTMGFFLAIFTWTVLWCGYNILATELPALHWPSFDPFPAFVAYLLISNVIQILLMPLIMVGQNLQGQHSEIRAELDFQINQKAEKEVIAVMEHLEHNTELLIQLMRHLDCKVSAETMRAIEKENELATAIEQVKVTPDL